MFKSEKIYSLSGSSLKVSGCEILADTGIPNQILFASENTELECFLFHTMMNKQRLHTSYVHSNNFFWTMNLSPAAIEKICNELPFLPSNFFIEITEKGRYSEDFIDCAKPFSHMLILDDFGTGYANMEAVYKLKPHGVKIDKTFFGSSAAYLKSLISELRNYVSVIIAEKVENEDDFALMKELGADFFQGFYMPSKKLKNVSRAATAAV
ncbi:EAL domain-containing protein [Geovibrio thiophilus]|nr:EAL domain-containing protein [Geovibrio thiophilus]